jgi:RNA polymerase sigma-70 factor (ECF subfamily)
MSRRLYCQAYRILRNQEGSEDAVQEIFTKLWKMNAGLGKYDSVDALASKMLKNYCIDQIRKQKYRENNNSEIAQSQNNPELSPHDELEKNETVMIIDRIIGSLPVIYREIIHFREIEGLDYEEISVKTGQNINTLRVNLSRARKMIKGEYEKYFNESGRNKTTA